METRGQWGGATIPDFKNLYHLNNMSLLSSLTELAEDTLKVVSAPLEIGVKLIDIPVKQICEITEDILEELE